MTTLAAPLIRFRFSPEKAREAVSWMLQRQAPLDLHTVLKACYFADKQSLKLWRRPVFGARYRAMRYGPVPLEIYELLKGDPLWLAELGLGRLAWELEGFRIRPTANEHHEPTTLTDADLECLKDGLAEAVSLTFDARTAETHGPDWQKARLGIMAYEDMIEEGGERDAIIEYLRENAPYMRL